MVEVVAFWLMLALFLTHELDAVRRHEWRILPLTSFLPEQTGAWVFTWTHVPLIFLLFWIAQQGPDSIGAILLSGFAIVHIGLHWLFRNHAANEFNNPASRLLIWLPGLAGLGHLTLVFV